MKYFFLSAILLFSFFAYSFAQNEWLSGYVLKTNKDTLFGLIENTGNKSNSYECHFRRDLSGEIQIYKPQDIFGYRYNDGKFFLSRKVIDKNGESQVFLEFLINGKIKMYHLGDETDRYFVEKDTMFYELLNTEEIVKQDYGEYLRKKKEYLGILNHLMNDGDMTNKISSLNFSAKSLIKISEEYHHKVCPNEACIVYEKNFNPVHVSWGPVLGVSLNRIKFGGMISSGYSFSNSFGLRFEFENLFHWVEKLSIVTELSMQKFSRYNISSNGKIQEYLYYNEKTYWNDFQDLKVDIETKTLKIPIVLNYTFSKGSLRPYVGLGYINMFVLSQNKDFKFDPFYKRYNQSIPNYSLGFVSQFGVRKKIADGAFLLFELKFEYTQTTDIQPDYKFKNNLWGLTGGLLF